MCTALPAPGASPHSRHPALMSLPGHHRGCASPSPVSPPDAPLPKPSGLGKIPAPTVSSTGHQLLPDALFIGMLPFGLWLFFSSLRPLHCRIPMHPHLWQMSLGPLTPLPPPEVLEHGPPFLDTWLFLN